MKKEDKSLLINDLAATIQEYSHFYVADAQGLNAADTSNLRRRCYKSDIKLVVVKIPVPNIANTYQIVL